MSECKFRAGKFVHELYFPGVIFLWPYFCRINFPFLCHYLVYVTEEFKIWHGIRASVGGMLPWVVRLGG